MNKKLASTVKHILGQSKGVVAIILFGSQARGQAKSGSDIDIAVLFEHNAIPDALEMIAVRQELSEQLHKEVDLVCLNTADPILKMQVYQYGKILFKDDEKAYHYYLIKLFNEYMELKELRKPMEEQILKRTFYGG